jgi:hypothetical protein
MFGRLIEGTLNLATSPVRLIVAVGEEVAAPSSTVKEAAIDVAKRTFTPEEGDVLSMTGVIEEDT